MTVASLMNGGGGGHFHIFVFCTSLLKFFYGLLTRIYEYQPPPPPIIDPDTAICYFELHNLDHLTDVIESTKACELKCCLKINKPSIRTVA